MIFLKINEMDDHLLMGSKTDMFTRMSVTLQVLPQLYGVTETKIAKFFDNFMMRIL